MSNIEVIKAAVVVDVSILIAPENEIPKVIGPDSAAL